MKYLIILGLLVLIGGLIYWRIRPYIIVVRRVLGVLRGAQITGVLRDEAADFSRRPTEARTGSRGTSGEKLTRCAACGTWLPASRALTLRHSTVSYCSPACLERSATSSPRTRKSAS